jgi:hypothetical protein
MIRKFLIVSMALTLIWSTVGCATSTYDVPANAPQVEQPAQTQSQPASQTALADGEYPVQQATYDDSIGEYSLVLLNTAPDQSFFRTENLPLAQLTDEQIAAGERSYLQVEQGQPSLYLTPDFRIEYVHNVTETQTNPQTGQPEVVVVRQEPSFWTPFAGALAGQALGSLLFTPQYYFPPVYQPGVPLTGYGSYGRTYDQAIGRYQSRYQAPPAEVRNRQFRATGRLRQSPGAFGQRQRTDRPSGSGVGNSDLRRANPDRVRTPRNTGFGSGRSRSSGRRRR